MANKESASDTTNKPLQQTNKENETVTVKNGCYYPWDTGLETDDAMQGLVNDAIKAWSTNPDDPSYPCGAIENGGAVTIYLKYEWETKENHSPVDKALREAGRKWGQDRPPEQKEFMKKCVRALQEKMNVTKEETEMLLLMNLLGSTKQTQHMDSSFNPDDGFKKDDVIGCIMLTQGYKTHWMETEEEMQIDNSMSIPTLWTIHKDCREVKRGQAYAFPPYIPHYGPSHPKKIFDVDRVVLMVVFADKPIDGPPIYIEHHKKLLKEHTRKQKQSGRGESKRSNKRSGNTVCSFGAVDKEPCASTEYIQECTTENCRTQLHSCRNCSVRHSKETEYEDDITSSLTCRICPQCCGCEKCKTRRKIERAETRNEQRTPSTPQQRKKQPAGTPVSQKRKRQSPTAQEHESTSGNKQTPAAQPNKDKTPIATGDYMERLVWFQHIHANPNCRWRSFDNNEKNCTIFECNCPLRTQYIRQMTEVICGNDKSFLELGIHKTPEGFLRLGIHKTREGRKAINDWCEQDTETQKKLQSIHRQLAMTTAMKNMEAFRTNPQTWQPPPYLTDENGNPDDIPGDIDEEKEGDDEHRGEWVAAEYNTDPDITDNVCKFPWGEGTIGNEFWIWEGYHQPDTERTHNTKTETILVTIVLDSAATKQTIKLDWKEHTLRTGTRGNKVTGTNLLSEDWTREGYTEKDMETVMGDCLFKELQKHYHNVAVMYMDRPTMDERVRTSEQATGVGNDEYDREIIIDFSLFTRGSPRSQMKAAKQESEVRTIHDCEEDIKKTYEAYSQFERKNGKATFIPPLKLAINAAKIHSQQSEECAYANARLQKRKWPSRLRVAPIIYVDKHTVKDTVATLKKDRPRNRDEPSYIYRREYASGQQSSAFAIKEKNLIEIASESEFEGTVTEVHKEGSYFKILFINLQRMRFHRIYEEEDKEIREDEMTAEHIIMAEEAQEYVRNLYQRTNRLYKYLAQVIIAKTQRDAMDYTIISVDSYPTMELKESEPPGMWQKKDITDFSKKDCNTHRVGDALAHSIRDMIIDITPVERKKPDKVDEAMKIQIEKTLDTKYDNINRSTKTPYIATQWKDGTKTHPTIGKKPTLIEKELSKISTTLKERGNDETKELDDTDKQQ